MVKVETLPSGRRRIRYTDPWGRRQSVTRDTVADVRAAYRRILADMHSGDYTDPRRGRTTVAQWADDWLTGARNVGPGGREMYEQALAHILPELGKLPVARVSPADIDRYLDGKLGGGVSTRDLLTDGHQATTGSNREPVSTRNLLSPPPGTLAPSTVHRHYRTLHRMFAVAVERGIVARNPCEHVQPPKVPRSDFTVLAPDQIDQLAATITSRYRGWVYLAAYSGLRWSEAVGLRRSRVDGPRVSVLDQLVRRRAPARWDRCPPKWGSVRTVTLPGFAADELADHLGVYALAGPDGLVFPTRNRTPIQGPSWTSNTFKRALVKAGLPNIRVHDMRHTAAALAIAAGAHPKAIQERMGHRSIKTTLDTYGHLFESADATVARGLEALRGTRHLRAVP